MWLFEFVFWCIFNVLVFGYRDDDHFDYFMLAQVYPTAVCTVDNDAVSGSCEIPSRTAHWIIHGLWPSRRDGSPPQFCRGISRKFHIGEVDSIESSLESKWPNLFTGKSVSSLWKHEWEKHGTCAASLSSTRGELNYFSETLSLHDQYSIDDALKHGGILPGDSRTYTLDDIEKAIQTSLTGGHSAQIHCLKDPKTSEYLLADVRICFDKDFRPMDCTVKRRWNNNYQRRRYKRRGGMPTYEPCPHEGIRYVLPVNGFDGDYSGGKHPYDHEKYGPYDRYGVQTTSPTNSASSHTKWYHFILPSFSRLIHSIKSYFG